MDVMRAQMDDIIDRETNDDDHRYRLRHTQLIPIHYHDANDCEDDPKNGDDGIRGYE